MYQKTLMLKFVPMAVTFLSKQVLVLKDQKPEVKKTGVLLARKEKEKKPGGTLKRMDIRG